MEITATMVKELRQRSGAGMMECKKALTRNDGNVDAAVEWLRKQGLAKADKKADRIAAEGRIALAESGNSGVLVEINSETDFVAKDENFLKFAEKVAEVALASGANDADALKAAALDAGTVEQARQALVARLGENVQVRRAVRMDDVSNLGAYVHGGRIGVLVALEGGDAELAHGIALHAAAMSPRYVTPADVPMEFVAKEKEIALAQLDDKDKRKPPEIQEKIVMGRVNKTLNEISLTGQPYVLEPDSKVGDVLAKANAKVAAFYRLAVGEGIEKREDDFHAEVMKQAGLA